LKEFPPVLHYAVVFLVMSLIAAVLGFGGIAAQAASIAKGLFFIFVALAAIAFLLSLKRKT
jgi:uncharacterized membrane protein YtjA (UPF0391 family)